VTTGGVAGKRLTLSCRPMSFTKLTISVLGMLLVGAAAAVVSRRS
jgi:hypothetical protein